LKSKLQPTTEDAFVVGKLEGTKEALEEILEMTKVDNINSLRIYLKARLKSLKESTITNPFRRKS
jgi:hypothetical protein